MKILFKHVYGEQENFDLQVCKPFLILDFYEEAEALANGWTIYHNDWFQSRMTRINLCKYNKPTKPIKDHTVVYYDSFNYTDEIKQLYSDFKKAKNYSFNYDLDSNLDRSSLLAVKKEDKIVAFTKFIKYNGGLESQFTIWDYVEPKLSIGKRIVDFEVQQAKDMGLDYLYVGCGYGLGGVYKSRFPGFEWWTGSEWSDDIQRYLALCERDSKVKNLADLNEVFNDS